MIRALSRTALGIVTATGIVLFTCGGCSGGTTGTGRPATIVTGRIFLADGSPVTDGSSVTVLQTGDSAPVSGGLFELALESVGTTLSFLIENSNLQSVAELTGIPPQTQAVEVDIEISSSTAAKVTRVEYTTEQSADPTPTQRPATPRPSPTPSPTPTPVPTTLPRPTPSPTSKPISTSTPQPIQTPVPTQTPNGTGGNNDPTATPIPSVSV